MLFVFDSPDSAADLAESAAVERVLGAAEEMCFSLQQSTGFGDAQQGWYDSVSAEHSLGVL